ncbi:SDR family NAD(P)-dependent oxidoreductase [Streptomyces sp. NPDC058307]|uniref:SDR family NAD(P)-dependent oxidoreductase n=1 Tax=Streptomyces sp. NPDC058307 TaxID=3346439 RepID=UPI0036E5EA8A
MPLGVPPTSARWTPRLFPVLRGALFHAIGTLVVGGSGGLGEVIARHFTDRGDDVIATSRDKARAEATAARIGAGARGLALDLGRPETIGADLAAVTEVDHVVITAVGQAANSLAQFNVTDAVAAVTMKLVGYAEDRPRAARPLPPRRLRRPLRRAREGTPRSDD